MAKIRPIVKIPEKILRSKAKEIPVNQINKPAIQRLISDMQETLKNTPDGVGLAAPQIGESVRVFIVSEEALQVDKKTAASEASPEDLNKNTKKEWKYFVFINPVIKKMSQKKVDGAEGCLSVPGKYGEVKRAEKITVEAYDENGKKFTRGASKFFARVLQHELDHLEGVLFIDKAEHIENISFTKS